MREAIEIFNDSGTSGYVQRAAFHLSAAFQKPFKVSFASR
jgi:hypothetical protein